MPSPVAALTQNVRMPHFSYISAISEALLSSRSRFVTITTGSIPARSTMQMSLSAVVKETAHRLEPMAQKRNHTVTLSLDDSGDMYADKSKLRQVIYNLLDNAIKYTQDGGKINLSIARAGRDIILTVSDNGPGIRPEHLPHVFDRFYRIDKARSRDSGGTGLGLSIVRQIVLLHGGSIRAVSEEGKGSSFIVELPIHKG